MALVATDRVGRIYDAIAAANPALTGKDVSDAEREQVRSQLTAMFGTDLAYLVQNTVVNSTTGTANPGASVQVAVPAGTGTVTGTGTLRTNVGTIS